MYGSEVSVEGGALEVTVSTASASGPTAGGLALVYAEETAGSALSD